MGKRVKGKSRQDKFYHLAKETGYRSRASFKLIQLNRKFDFLPRCRVCIDLCAAPGGWMQVAKQHMPVSSLIVGVDLFPIRPIPGCIGLVEDITTDKCRASLKAELKTWKADLILHDGAPNVGQNWIHDAFIQNQLVLSALKLATEFLQKGGWFITKIFRSKDYQSLIWALSQLFRKVQSTKPQASRLETAEIFVICQGFKAPDKLDPRFLDPKHVFKEVESSQQLTKAQPQLGAPLARKPKAEGYEEGKLNLYSAIPVMEFINSETYLDILANATEILLDDERIAKHVTTTVELRECLRDIKVLGKKDIRDIINWRKALKKEFEKEQAKKEESEAKESEVVEKVDEIEEGEKELNELDTEIEAMKLEKLKEIKRKKKRVVKERKKLVDKMNLDMVIPGDQGPILEEMSLFKLKTIHDEDELDRVAEQELDNVEFDEETGEPTMKRKKVRWAKETGKLDDEGLYYKDDNEFDHPESDIELASDEETLGFEPEPQVNRKKMTKAQLRKQEKRNPLIADLQQGDAEERKRRKAESWFEQDLFAGVLEDDADEDMELDIALARQRKPSAEKEPDSSKPKTKQQRLVVAPALLQAEEKSKAPAKSETQTGKDSGIDASDDEDDSDSDSDTASDSELVDMKKEEPTEVGSNSAGFEVVSKEETRGLQKRNLGPEGLALGTMMIQSKKAKRDMIDDGYNRYMFNDENLPSWFMDDEEENNKRPPPVTRELIALYREELKDANVRTIKKVVEAKARKKRRAVRKMDKAKKKIEAISADMGMTDYDKAQQIRSLYKKAMVTKKKEVKYVVTKKNQAAAKASRPKGTEGPYKLVDKRMKSDRRGKKAADRRNKRLGKGKPKSKGFSKRGPQKKTG